MNNTAATPDREPLAGLVERVTYHNPDNGYCVLRVKVRGHHDLVTVLGHAASISPGEFAQASGKWEVHREHGQQFKAVFLKSAPPSSLEGMEKYLGSGLIKGIGPVYAKKLIKAFGEAVFDVIEQQGERLTEVAGIGLKRASKIRLAWSDQKAIREIMVFLQSHGVGTSRAVRIYKTYGADAIPLVTENPYRLARDIRGIGFKTAGMIAEKLGIPKTAMIRARAGISYALLNAVDDDHCGLPRDELLKLAEVFRQAAESQIITNAHRINAGRLPDLKPPVASQNSDFYFVDAVDSEDAARLDREPPDHPRGQPRHCAPDWLEYGCPNLSGRIHSPLL